MVSGLVFAGGWQLDMDEKGVQLYTMDSEHSNLKQVKVVTTVKASLSTLVSFLSDDSVAPDWMDKISKAEKVKELSETEAMTYVVVDAPWPERDRDMVLYSRWEQDPKTFVVTRKLFSEPQYLKENDTMIRSPYFQGKWELTPKGRGVVEVAYSRDYVPGGETQGWIHDLFTYEIPLKTMANLRAASFNKYQNARVAFIKEPVNDNSVAMSR